MKTSRMWCLATVSAQFLLLAACGGGGGGSAGTPATVPPPPPPVIRSFSASFSADDVVGGSTAGGSATGMLELDATNERVTATVALSNIAATGVGLHRGFAGEIGAEIVPLTQGTSVDQWVLDQRTVTAAEMSDLDGGQWYLEVATANGALRGQLLIPGIEVHRFALLPEQVASGSESPASGIAWVTEDRNSSVISVHAEVTGLDDAIAASLHFGMAGVDGAELVRLDVDMTRSSHWYSNAAVLTSDIEDALAGDMLYVELANPTFPDGAIRGQLLTGSAELVITDLTSDAILLAMSSPSAALPAARMMTTIDAEELTANVNVYSVTDATGVELRQAPAGQNGPVIATFIQGLNNPALWSLHDVDIDDALRAGIDNRTLYVVVNAANAPDGAARGQIQSAASSEPHDSGAFVVTSTDPANASNLDALPAAFFATLNREPLPSSVTPGSVTVEASGNDGSFDDGNEVPITPASITTNGNTVEISFDGIVVNDEVFRVTLAGGGDGGIVDLAGIALDGDSDGQPGGLFESAFEVETPAVQARLFEIQAQIFDVSCATSGCHSGSNPPDGLDLTAGNSYANTVGISSVQMPSLNRIEPGDPDNSYLVRKVEGAGIVANRMPLGKAPLSQEQIDLIRAWVTDGAQDN